eukprot:g11618.t1
MDVHAAALSGDVEGVRRYVSDARDPNILNEAGITPLHSAAVQGQAEVIRVLVAAGADTDLKVCRGKEGTSHDASPLLLAAVGGHLEAARVLLEGGAEVGAKNSKGLTPLHVSCLKPNAAMVSLLLLWGADTNARDRRKRTPEQIIGRLGKDPAEEQAVRAVLREAAAARRSTLTASSANAAQHPALETIDETAGSGGASAATDGTIPAASIGAAETPLMLPPPPPAATGASRQPHENSHPMAPPPPPSKTMLPAHTESRMPGEVGATPQGPVPPRPTSPPPVQVPPGLPPKNAPPPPPLPPLPPLPPPPPPSKHPVAADGCESTNAVGALQPPTPLTDERVQAGTPAASVVVERAAGGAEETGAVAAVQFACGAVLEREYELEKVLPCSSGSSELWFASKVFTGEEVVVKKVAEGKEVAFERERAVLKFLQRHGVKGEYQHSIPFAGVIPKLRCLVLVRGAKTLRQIGQKYYQRFAGNAPGYMDRIRPYARQVVEVAQWLHRLGVVWGDAKPENFVEGQDGDLKAIDFDSACFVLGGTASTDSDITKWVGSRFSADHVLTPRYCAPERARASVSGETCLATKATDVWSIGMVLFWLLTGQDYFEEGLTDAEVVRRLCSPGFQVSLAGVDPKQEQARNLLGTMLSHEPTGRGTMDSVLGRAFFAGGASVTAAKMQAEMAASLSDVSTRLEATIREEGDSTRSFFDESMKRLESRADEMLSKLGRMDRMLDHVVEGSADCPRLFVLTPATDVQLWKPDTWFSDHNLLTFLCAHDLAPVGNGIKVPCPRSNLEKWAPAIQASTFVVKLGCKAACMTAGVSPATVDGMSAALGINFLAGQKVSAALRSAAGKALGDLDDEQNKRRFADARASRSARKEALSPDSSSERSVSELEEREGRKLTGEAYEALMSFLDENEPSWRSSLRQYMTKAVRGDGKVSWTCHEHADAWSRSGSLSGVGISGVPAAGLAPGAGRVNNALGSRNDPSKHDADCEAVQLEDSSRQAAAAAAAEPSAANQGDGKKNVGSNIRKHGKGLGVFAKIKGRFGRHAG